MFWKFRDGDKHTLLNEELQNFELHSKIQPMTCDSLYDPLATIKILQYISGLGQTRPLSATLV
jgi:hypothetical protein